jgi:hypothetical protein
VRGSGAEEDVRDTEVQSGYAGHRNDETSPLPLIPAGLTIADAPLHLHASCAGIVVLVAAPWLRSGGEVEMVAGIVAGIVALLSMAWHEAGHAWAARAHGAEVVRIDLRLWGGRCQWRGDLSLSAHARISAAGPAASVLLAGLLWFVVEWSAVENASAFVPSVARMCALLNLGWAAYNLVPVRSQDGAVLVDWAAQTMVGPARAARVSRGLRWVVVVGLVALAFAAGLPVFGLWVAALAAWDEAPSPASDPDAADGRDAREEEGGEGAMQRAEEET